MGSCLWFMDKGRHYLISGLAYTTTKVLTINYPLVAISCGFKSKLNFSLIL